MNRVSASDGAEAGGRNTGEAAPHGEQIGAMAIAAGKTKTSRTHHSFGRCASDPL
jgi:hypothetical protein